MSYVPMFGIGECTAQAYAFKITWLQDRRINGITDENKDYNKWDYIITAQARMVLRPDGKLIMGMCDGHYKNIPDTRYEPVDFINLRREGEDLYTWSQRMQREYTWKDYLDVVDPEDWQYLTEEIFRQQRLRSAA